MKVLVIEDNKQARRHLEVALESELFVVDSASDGASGSYLARTNDYDIVLLDDTLPKKTGVEVCKELRSHDRNMPILMFTGKTDDRTRIFEAGADGYLEKPYCYRELVSQIKAMIRRSTSTRSTRYMAGSLILDCEAQEAYVDRKNVYLTPKEFLLLELLLRNKGRVVSRGMILEYVWNSGANPFSKTIETHILNLRRKIDIKKDKLIHAIPGRGYKICDGR